MGEQRFDELTKSLATRATSRGSLLRGALAAAAGAMLAGRVSAASADTGPGTCGQTGVNCTHQKCCEGYTCLVDGTSSTDKFCCPDNLVCGSRCCPAGAACSGGHCVCPPGTSEVRDRPFGICCVDALVCGNACLTTACNPTACEVCDPTQGRCVSICSGAETCIAGACCPNTRVCGNTCLATACDPTQCKMCDPTTGSCVAIPGCQTCTSTSQCLKRPCQQVTCTNGVCVYTPVANGTGCNDNNPCTTGDACLNGICMGTPVTCTPPNVCCTTGAVGQCRRPSGAPCSASSQCCNKCTSGLCT